MADLLDRARQQVAAGPYDARPAEIAAVHDTIWPEKAPVCPTLTCMRALGVAYFAIKRWAETQPDSSTYISTTVKKGTTARFKSDATIYTPHGLGVAYSNANLTNKAARDIIKNDPDAVGLFSELPGEADEDEQDLTPAQAAAEQATEQAQSPAATLPIGFDLDYTKLASAMVDELERREQEHDAQFAQRLGDSTLEQPTLTASTGGVDAEATQVQTETLDNGVEVTTGQPDAPSESDHDEEKPVRLSRMNKEQLTAAYTTELGVAPAESLTNDDLRNAIAEKRASLQDPE